LGGNGTVGGATTINGNGIHAPGATLGAIGIQTFSSSLTYISGSTFEWDLDAPSVGGGDPGRQGTYDQVEVATGAVSVLSGAIFKIDLADANFSSEFWNSTRTWDNIFTGSGSPSLFGTSDTFTEFTGTDGAVAADGTVAGEGYFYFTGSTLNWIQGGGLSAIPEPGGLLALGCLIGSGLCLRSRRRGAGPQLG
jgi:hypothetical protein